MREIRIGLMQLKATASLEDSIKQLQNFSKRIKYADVVILPEYAMIDPTDLSPSELLNVAEDLERPGRWLKDLINLARRKEICLIGTLFSKEAKSRKARNTAVLINNKGEIVSYYNKTHLFDALGFKESEKFEAGDRLFEPMKFCDIKIGLAICFELRFPEVFRYEALKGAELIAVPAAWYRGPLKESMLKFLSQTRAHENTLFLAVSALSGERFTGGSTLVDPLGFNILDLGPEPKYIEINIDLNRIYEVRRYLPLLKLMRNDLYSLS